MKSYNVYISKPPYTWEFGHLCIDTEKGKCKRELWEYQIFTVVFTKDTYIYR